MNHKSVNPIKMNLCIALVFFMAVTMLSACGAAVGPNESTSAGSTISQSLSAADSEIIDPFAKYDTPVTLTYAKRTIQGANFKDGDSEENNYWTRQLKEQGIELELAWSADASQYSDRCNVAIASGDIPDILNWLTASQAIKLEKGDMLTDMKPYLDKYISPQAKGILDTDDGAMFNYTVKDGKQYILPQLQDSLLDQVNSLWIRKDWLQKVNLTVPKSLDDFLKICDAFVTQDPDGNGKKDTYAFGIAGKDNMIKDWGSLIGFFTMFHVQPCISVYDGELFYEKDSSGKIIWSGSKPEVKTALSALQEMYKKGYIAADFASSDGGKLSQDLLSNKCGMLNGAYWLSYWPLNDLKSKIPDSDWVVTSFPSVDGDQARPSVFNPSTQFVVVSNKCKNPDAVVKCLNWFIERRYGSTAEDMEYQSADMVNDYGKSTYNNPMAYFVDIYAIQNTYLHIQDALKTKDASKLNTIEKTAYDNILKYQSDPVTQAPGLTGLCTAAPRGLLQRSTMVWLNFRIFKKVNFTPSLPIRWLLSCPSTRKWQKKPWPG